MLRIVFAIGQGAVQGGVLRIMFAIGRCQGAVQGAPDHVCHWAVSGCCAGVLFRVLRIMFVIGVLSRVLRIMFAIGRCQGAVQGAPDHVCHWAVSGCCAGVLFRVLRIMFAIGRCQGAVCCPGSRVLLRIMFAIGRCQGAVQGAPDHVCLWAVSGCCSECC